MTIIRSRHVSVGDGEPLEIFEITGRLPGPTVSLIGGVHGGEEEGVLSVRRLIQFLSGPDITGTVRCLPVANPAAFNACSRVSPLDGKKLGP